MNWEYLVSLDIGSIHDYIFGTNKLREIRGASILLDKLNRKFPINELKNGEYGDWESVIFAGGNIKILFKEKTKAEGYKEYLANLFRDKAPGAKVTVIVSGRKGLNEEQWIKKAEKELQSAKSLCKGKEQILTCGFFKICEACGLYPAEKEDVRPEGGRYICKTCYQKVEESKNYRDTEIYKEITKGRDILDFPNEFSEIGKESEPEGYIGFIYADGNRMGEHISKITSFSELQSFSSDVHNATLKATISAINNHFHGDYLPIQVILAGGDDLILALPAQKAIDVAIDFCEKFNEQLLSRSITTCAGIVICHDSLPIKNVLSAADALLKNAKAESRKKDGGTYMDFIVVAGSALENPISKRNRELKIEDRGTHYITKRPYSLEGIKTLRKTINTFKSMDFPKNKLKMLYASLFKGHYQSILDACYIKTRLSKEHKGLIDSLKLTRFPWEELNTNEYSTPFGDIVELYEVIK